MLAEYISTHKYMIHTTIDNLKNSLKLFEHHSHHILHIYIINNILVPCLNIFAILYLPFAIPSSFIEIFKLVATVPDTHTHRHTLPCA